MTGRFGGSPVDVMVRKRDVLDESAVVAGPAIVAELTGTTFVAPGWVARVSREGSLVIDHDEPEMCAGHPAREEHP